MYIAHIVKKWRDKILEGTEEKSPSLQKLVDTLNYYERSREEARKKFPQFINQLTEMVVPEKPKPVEPPAEKPIQVEAVVEKEEPKKIAPAPKKVKKARGEDDEWSKEARDFTKGLFDNEEESAEFEDETLENLDEEDLTENAADNDQEEAEDSEEGENLSLDHLLKTISGRADKEIKEPSHNQGYRKMRRKKRSRKPMSHNDKNGKDSDKKGNDGHNKKNHMKW